MNSDTYFGERTPSSPDQPYTVAFDEDNGAKYLCCERCCLLLCQTKCLLLACFPCLNFCLAECPKCLYCLYCPCEVLKKQDATITDKQIEYKTGWPIRKTINIPIDRVKDVEVVDGWFWGSSISRTWPSGRQPRKNHRPKHY